MSKNDIQNAIKLLRTGREVPVSKVTNDLKVAAIMSKLLDDPIAKSRAKNTSRFGPDAQTMRKLSDNTSSKITDSRNFMQLLPDLRLGTEILISSILSPKDMIESSVSFVSQCETLPPAVLATLNSISDEFFTKDYKIRPLLPKILQHCLVETGSYAIAVLPENAIDDVINGHRTVSTESYKEILKQDHYNPIGILGKSKYGKKKETVGKKRFAFESFDSFINPSVVSMEDCNVTNGKDTLHVVVNDNPNILRRGILAKQTLMATQQRLTGFGKALESDDYYDLYASQQARGIYKSAQYRMRPMVIFKTQDQLERRSATDALIFHIPSEAIIPVFAPGSPSDHLGYFVLLDEAGNPLSTSKVNDYYDELRQASRSTSLDGGSSTSSFVQRINSSMISGEGLSNNTINTVVNAYTDMIEQDLKSRLDDTILRGATMKIPNQDAIYRMMLARDCAQQYTQILYLPKDLLSYIAIDHNECGIGKSLLDDMGVLNSLRVISLFANAMASIRNSINRTHVNVKLDEEDLDPWGTIETTLGELNRSRSSVSASLPVGTSGPAEVVEWLNNAGYEFSYEGHPEIPDMKIDFSEQQSNYAKVDTEFEEDLRKRTCMALGVPPEIIDNAFSADFAVVAVQNNILLSKRVLKIQEAIIPHLSDHCRRVIVNSETLVEALRAAIAANIDGIIARLVSKTEIKGIDEKTEITEEVKRSITNSVLNDYISSFEVSLPRPNSVELENQVAALETYLKAVDLAITYFFDSAFVNSDAMGELGESVDLVKESIKATLCREWMAKNNFMGEMFDFVTTDETGKLNSDAYQSVVEHVRVMTNSFGNLLKTLKPIKILGDKYIAENELGADASSSGSDDGDSSGDDAEAPDGLDMGDMNFDDTDDEDGEGDAAADDDAGDGGDDTGGDAADDSGDSGDDNTL